MSIKVAINGFGRIGRLVARHLVARDGFDLVAVNDLTSPDMLGYLFAHDSVHGPYRGTVEVDGSDLIIDGDRMRVLAERDPASFPGRSSVSTTSSRPPVCSGAAKRRQRIFKPAPREW